MHQLYMVTMDPDQTRKVIRLADYHKSYAIRLKGLLPELMVDQGCEWVLHETGVLLPRCEVPLVGAIVPLLRRVGKGVMIDALYNREVLCKLDDENKD